jgi:hypothetical protein
MKFLINFIKDYINDLSESGDYYESLYGIMLLIIPVVFILLVLLILLT